jgi:phosphate starvation-inducible protein PhoH
MTPKEKAKELVDRFEQHSKAVTYGFNFSGDIDHSVECALICVDEIIESIRHIIGEKLRVEYYLEVEQEIKKL